MVLNENRGRDLGRQIQENNTAGKDGAKYVGQFKNDKKEGQGVYYYPSGAKYTGQWVTR